MNSESRRPNFTAGVYPDSGEAFVTWRDPTWAWRGFDLRILSGLLAVSQCLPSAARGFRRPLPGRRFGQFLKILGMFACRLSSEMLTEPSERGNRQELAIAEEGA